VLFKYINSLSLSLSLCCKKMQSHSLKSYLLSLSVYDIDHTDIQTLINLV
jgi:hypothetical protein